MVKKLSQKFLIKIIIAIFYTAFLCFVPWEDFRSIKFADREKYIDYFLYQVNVISYLDLRTITDYITGEWLWHASISNLATKIDLQIIFLSISFLCIFVFSSFLIINYGLLSVLFLINPLVIDFAFSQYRMALAISFLYLGYFARNSKLWIPFVVAAPFLHTGSIIFIVIYFVSNKVALRNINSSHDSSIKFKMVLVLVGFLISFLLGPLREQVLGYFGDRRVGYAEISSSFSYLSVWILLFVVLLAQKKYFLNYEENCFSIVILSIVMLNIIFAGYSTRFLAASYPLLIGSILSVKRELKNLYIKIFLLYCFIQWIYWSGISFL